MNRRKFIENFGLLSSSFALNFKGVYVTASPNIFSFKKNLNSDKVLVLLQLFGGNDGLNTLIPYEDDIYYRNRPTLGIKKNRVLKISSTLGFHPEMPEFQNLFNEGRIKIIQNIGYENPNRSHFRSTDIWKSASDENQYIYNGWTARHLYEKHSTTIENLKYPLAIELGWAGSMLVELNNKNLGLYMGSPDEYFSLTRGGSVTTDNSPINKKAEDVLNYINDIAVKSYKYSNIIKESSDKGKNTVSYPDSFLGNQMSIIAKLISGGIETPVYIAKLKGFDTHLNQLGDHDLLLKQLSQAVSVFQKDLENQDLSDKVSLLIFSEFGRRVKEHYGGTDHGTAAPTFVVGSNVDAGILGNDPNLDDLDSNGDVKYKYDFRQVYSTILQDHLNESPEYVKNILSKDFNTIPIYKNSRKFLSDSESILKQNYPNPSNGTTLIEYFLVEMSQVKLQIQNIHGAVVKSLVDQKQQSGEYKVTFDTANFPQGLYFYCLTVNEKRYIKKLII